MGDDVLLNRIGQNGNVKGDPQVGLAALRLAETERENPAALLLKRLSAYSIYTPDTPILRGWTPDIQIREPLGLSGGRLAEAVGEMINGDHHDEELSHLLKAVPWFGAFGVESLHKQEAYEHSLSFIDRYFGDEYRNKYLLSSNDVNEGVLYLLFAVVLCLHPNAPPLLAIDNADHSLNPLLTLELMTAVSGWVLSSTQKRQIVLTTHDPLALDGLPLQDDRVRLFTVDRDNRGHTQVRRLKITDKHREMAAKGWTLSRMWVNKLLGGVPDV